MAIVPQVHIRPREHAVQSLTIVRASLLGVALRILDVAEAVWRREPTLFIELGVIWTILVWSMSLIVFGISAYSPSIAEQFERVPHLGLAASGFVIIAAQAVSIVARSQRGREYASLLAAMWLGYLSFALLAGNARIPGGLVYLGHALASLLPYWRSVAVGRRR